jgi:hypothetical protein
VQAYEHKDELHSYYKLIEEALEDITKEWFTDLLISANPAEISDIDIPEDTHKEQNTPRTKK